ncbi:MAG: bifunctional nuclease family protein [Chloroflexi bacterium]|nr:bifunctional nuclease family protein [Chloroflexota bacterium]
MMNYQRVVILKEKHDERYLPIWIGPAEADAIAMKLHDVNVPRPLTHDLLNSVIGSLGASVNCVVVTALLSDTFYAKLVLDVDGRQMEIDSRPSDAIALAVRVKSPIFVDEEVMSKAGVTVDKETGKLTHNEAVTEDEINRMSAFKEFINNLDLADFDEPESKKD